MADRLVDLAGASQILLISHWPQLAARADRHFRVHKETTDTATSTRCVRLTPAQVAEELAAWPAAGKRERPWPGTWSATPSDLS